MDRNEASYIQNRKGERIYIKDDAFREFMETDPSISYGVADIQTCISIVDEILNFMVFKPLGSDALKTSDGKYFLVKV